MMLEMKQVTQSGKKSYLKDISFSLEKGYLMGLAGANGAGKTTLLKMILSGGGYDGELLIDGENVKDHMPDILNKIGYVSDDNSFFMNYSAKENEELLSGFYKEWDSNVFENTLDKMGVSGRTALENLSRGEYMKFQMAFAMAHNTKLYLLDEVTGGMDPIYRKEFFRLMREILEAEEASIILVTHIQEEIEVQMDYIGIMEQGRMRSFKENGGE